MNKLFIFSAFCFSNMLAMQNPLLSATVHENEPVTVSPATTETGNLRSLISLNEAIRLGKLIGHKDKVTYRDFEAAIDAPPCFSTTFQEINTHIYSFFNKYYRFTDSKSLMQNARAVRMKIIKDPLVVLNEEELHTYQIPKLLAFLTYSDIHDLKQRTIDEINSDNDLSPNRKNREINLIENETKKITAQRSFYLAAIAARDAGAVNCEKTQKMHFEEMPLTLIQEIDSIRERANSFKGGLLNPPFFYT